jgi:hypothetical protein
VVAIRYDEACQSRRIKSVAAWAWVAGELDCGDPSVEGTAKTVT